ncbi:MAG TPA: FlgD immunoglobulin-like domain containing protein [bacterium]
MVINPTNDNIIFAAGSFNSATETVMAFCKSMDAGNTWSRSLLTTSQSTTYTLALHPSNPDIIFAGGCDGTNYCGKILKSIDGGITWSDASSGISQNYNQVFDLAIDPTSPNNIFAGCSNGIYKSTNNGASWNRLGAELNYIRDIVIDSRLPITIYAGSYTGVFCSTNCGQSWTAMNNGLTNKQIECLALDPINNLLFAGTNGGGVFRCEIATAVDPIAPEPVLPGQYALKSNYPNPFNSTTTINYEVPIGVITPVNLKIYNIFGQIVKTLFDGNQDAGRYTVDWDGSDDDGKLMTSGVYFCILQSGNYQNTKKMTLLR